VQKNFIYFSVLIEIPAMTPVKIIITKIKESALIEIPVYFIAKNAQFLNELVTFCVNFDCFD